MFDDDLQADWHDIHHTGPDTLAGRYLRTFWHPVCLGKDLRPGQARPRKVMSEDFTLYRGETGTAHAVGFRCAHRQTQLSTGWVQGDDIRCFYHGWRYDASGQCLEQPGEPEPFCQKVRIRTYPVQEYLGLIFAYFGEGEPPDMPRYPDYDQPPYDADGYIRNCNYFDHLDNEGDSAHIAFVHNNFKPRDWSNLQFPSVVQYTAEEDEWGIVAHKPNAQAGSLKLIHWGMPNILGGNCLRFQVPMDDDHHYSFFVGPRNEDWFTKGPQAEEYARKILAGELTLREVEEAVDFDLGLLANVQDSLSQNAQGIPDHTQEHLGREDTALILRRRLYMRELKRFAAGEPLKQWRRTPEMMHKAEVAEEWRAVAAKKASAASPLPHVPEPVG